MMLQSLRAILPLTLTAEIGLILVLMLRRHLRGSIAELTGLVLALGMGSLATLLFWFSLAGLRPSPILQTVLAILLVPLLWVLARSTKGDGMTVHDPQPRIARIVWYCLAGLVTLSVTAVAAQSLLAPVTAWDAMAIWGLKARALTLFPLSAKPPWFYDPAFSFSHLDYPLLIPMAMASIYAAVDLFLDQAAKLTFVVVSAALVLTLYGGIARLAPRLISIALVAVLVTSPMVMHWAGTGYADIGVALYAGGAAIYYTLFVRDGGRSDLVVAVLMSMFLAFTKNEGMPIAIGLSVIGVCFCLRSATRRHLPFVVLTIGAAALAFLPFIVWRSHIPKTHEDYGGRLAGFLTSAQLSRLPYVLKSILLEMCDVSHWGMIWFLPAAAIVFGFRRLRNPEVAYALCALGAQLAIDVAAYLVSPYTPQRLVPGTVDRLVLQAAPLAVIIVAAVYGRSTPREALSNDLDPACSTAG